MSNNNKENAQMQDDRLKLLIYKYLNQHLSKEEEQELKDFAQKQPSLIPQLERLQNEELRNQDLQRYASFDVDANRERTWTRIRQQNARMQARRRITPWITGGAIGVAAILIVFFGKSYLSTPKQKQARPTNLIATNIPSGTDVAPGTYKATLTLAVGTKIRLDSLQKGNTIDQPGSTLLKRDNTILLYNEGNKTPSNTGSFNTLTTPRAAQFSVQLQDGTKVWLNNASSLHYPTSFTGTNREVDLTGEAYFEVARDVSRPFHVNVNGLAVLVLGTHFNITAYDSSKTRTILSSGSVLVTAGRKQQLLKPGQSLNVRKDKNWKVEDNVDTIAGVAWTRGRFRFDQTEFSAALQQLARWYDVDIKILGGAREPVNANISRDQSLSAVLNSLKIPHVIEGKNLTILQD